MKKHHRLTVQAVRNLYPGMAARLVPASKHPKLEAAFAGHIIQVSISSSPSTGEDVIRNCVRDVRKRFKYLGIELPQFRPLQAQLATLGAEESR